MFKSRIIIPLLESIKRYGDRYSFCINHKYYSYSDFAEVISRVQIALINNHVNRDCVGLVVNDDIETYASIVALWLEGNSYVPLHHSWPIQRCLDIVSQTKMEFILDSSRVSRFTNAKIIHTSELLFSDGIIELREDVSGDSLAYILFTSGSTGTPKGVQISRDNLGYFMDSFWGTGITVDENDRCLQCFDLTFDVSIVSFLVPLTKGACCYTVPNGKVKYVYASGLIEDYSLTFATFAPSMIRYLKPYFDEIDMSSLRTCILTAEACPAILAGEIQGIAKEASVYNFYGPTEATIYCTYYQLLRGKENKSYNGTVSIGKPLSNVRSIIIDDNLNEVSDGEKGELCVSGEQISLGYLNNLHKNAVSFFTRIEGGECIRYYRTGDLCYKDPEGDIMYSGRLDHQAKIQGYRVEMGEIEYHASSFLSNCNVVAMPFINSIGNTEIALFIESESFDTKELEGYLRSVMPSYMLPSHIFFETVFPLNDNGKINKSKLLHKNLY